MSDKNMTLWDWLVHWWRKPRTARLVRFIAAGSLAAAGAIYLAADPGTGNWIPLLAAALVFLILGLRIEVAQEPLPVVSDTGQVLAAEPVPEPVEAVPPAQKEFPPAQAQPKFGVLSFLRLPLAAAAAFSAQWVMDFRPMRVDSARTFGWVLYALAVLLLGWAVFSGDAAFAFEAAFGKARGIKPTLQRIICLIGALFFAVWAYMGSEGGMFEVLALVFLAIAVLYWWVAFADYSGGFIESIADGANRAAVRIRFGISSLRHGITLSPWSLLVVLCFAALVFTRTYDMASIPPEMTSDHIEKLVNVADILDGMPYIFFANNGGREALEFYLVAFFSQVLGTGISFLSLKIVSIGAGIATLPFLYLLGRELADRRVGLLAMVLGGVGFWPDMISRIGLRLPLAMLFCAATLYFFYKALRRRSWNDFLWAGAVLGIGMYGYTPIRVVPLCLAVIVGLFLLHPSSKGSRLWAAAGSLLTLVTAVLFFIPFLRYAVDYPDEFWLRTASRIGSVDDPVGVFFKNLSAALQMFSWNDGVGWFAVVPLRPALDVVAGALYHLGFLGVVFHAFRKRSWEALSLFLLVPILLLPSILSLAMPNENPSMARAIAAVPVVFLLAALALVLLLDYLGRLIPGPGARWVGAVLAAVLVGLGAAQDFDLTLRQYPASYRKNSENASELGRFMREFYSSVGRPEDAYFIPYPYWVDDRIVNVEAGFPIHSVHYVFPDQIPEFEFSGRPTLFLLLAEDVDSLEVLKQKFPDGYYATVASSFPNHDFIFFLVPGTPQRDNP
jgi:hypothetical protein